MRCAGCDGVTREAHGVSVCFSCDRIEPSVHVKPEVNYARSDYGRPIMPKGFKGNLVKRLNLGFVDDPYVLGVLCEKLGLVEYALWTLVRLSDLESDRRRVFDEGRKDADGCSFQDVADDAAVVRKNNPAFFQAMVRMNRGDKVLDEVMGVIPVARGGRGERQEGPALKVWSALLLELPEDNGAWVECPHTIRSVDGCQET